MKLHKIIKFEVVCLLLVFIIVQNAYSLTDFDTSNNAMSINITVKRTVDFTLEYLPIRDIANFHIMATDNTDFMKKVYPLSDDGLVNKTDTDKIFEFTEIIDEFQNNDIKRNEAACKIMQRLKRFQFLADYVVGIAPQSFFADIGYENSTGLSCGLNAVLAQTNTRTTATHEISHDLADLCDEGDGSAWDRNNRDGTFCPNAEGPIPDLLDDDCNTNDGCEAFSIEPLTGQPDNTKLHNFMGSDNNNATSWVSNETYSILLNKTESSFFESLFFVPKRIMFSGKFVRSQSTGATNLTIDNTYILDEGFITTQNLSINNSKYEINLIDNNSNPLFNLRFNNSIVYDQKGTAEEVNGSYFVFIVPFNETLAKILYKENNTVKQEINVTANIPTITITSPSGSETFDKSFTLTWNASDLDNDTINYAVLISSDNGNTFSTLEIDYPNTTLKINSTNFVESNQYKIKILATDGINTGNDTSETFSIYHDIDKFLIKNASGSNIAWFGDAGNIVLKGVLEQNSNFIATNNFAFKIRNNLNDVLIIENNGSMYIDGTLQENQGTINVDMDRNEFRLKWNGEFKTNINETGYLFAKGTLTQNGNP